ncbi:MAG: SGNH/GDSL hydrolase family protein [Bacteroidetes bacterium]|nr:SGNH/GDSL hydrolase family protein [Bacteroidota bacterium]
MREAIAIRESTFSLRRALRLSLVLLQLIAVSWLANRYAIETLIGLPRLLSLATVGFAIHALLPFNWRLPFFLSFGLFAVFYLFDPVPAAVLLGLFAVLFGILQLPYSVRIRAILLLLAGAVLAAIWQFKPFLLPGAQRVIPVVGSIFMFRASLFLYEQQFEKQPVPLPQQLAYFFMLPNFVLTLFPVVDYKNFRKFYYNRSDLEIYQKGARLLIRGFCHLMLYRLVYYYFQPDPQYLQSLGQIAFYFATTYLLILRLSGIFHTSAGVLALFGFDLPPLFHNYFLASGFSDIWRRINTYWRDYVTKLIYFPLFFKLRKWGNLRGMVLTTLIAFLISWFLHSYQWFWLKGSFPVRTVDAVFWITFGVLVAANAAYQQKKMTKGPKKSRGINQKTAIRSLQIGGMFAFMSLIYTLWNSPSLTDWWSLIQKALAAPFGEWLWFAVLVFLFLGCLFVGLRLFQNPKIAAFLEPDDGKSLSVFWSLTTLSIFTGLTLPVVQNAIQPVFKKPLSHYFENRLNVQDDALKVQGYYEEILIANPFTSPLSDRKLEAENIKSPEDWLPFTRTKASLPVDDWRVYTLQPSANTIVNGAPFQTNAFGMRGPEVNLENPDNKLRIASLGGSYTAGVGVSNDEVFDRLCEEQFNKSSENSNNYQFLNFAVPGHHLLQSIHRFHDQVLDFKPDAVIIFSHGLDFKKNYNSIIKAYMSGLPLDLPFADSLARAAGIEEGKIAISGKDAVDEFSETLVDAAYKHLAESCKSSGIIPIFAFWPRTQFKGGSPEEKRLVEIAESHDFLILNMKDIYVDYDSEDLKVAPFDGHPNKLGHQLVADSIASFIKTRIKQKPSIN